MTHPVTREDREAAADMLRDAFGWTTTVGIHAGLMDDRPYVQAFAQHRVRAAERMREAAASWVEGPEGLNSTLGRTWTKGVAAVAAAIRALSLPTRTSETLNDLNR